jgi:homoserine O-acetyltransferase/O-succinyltransferase
MLFARTDIAYRPKPKPPVLLSMATLQQSNLQEPVLDKIFDVPLPESFLQGCLVQALSPEELAEKLANLEQPPCLKARIVGPANAPVILALGGISANRNPVDFENGSGQNALGWWRELFGVGCAIDTRAYRVLSFDFFPSDEWAKAFESRVTPELQAKAAKLVCEWIGVEILHAFIGASYGGMVGLHFAALFPNTLERLIVACAAHRPHPMGTAWRSIQRKMVRFGLDNGQPHQGLALARELGMTTYRTSQEFGQRFEKSEKIEKTEKRDNHPSLNGHPQQLIPEGSPPVLSYGVESYLEQRGQEFIHRMSPERYLCLSESIDLNDVNPQQIQVPVTLIGCRQDQLVPIEEMQSLQAQLSGPKTLHAFDSIYGHDAFLKEPKVLGHIFTQSLSHRLNPFPQAI